MMNTMDAETKLDLIRELHSPSYPPVSTVNNTVRWRWDGPDPHPDCTCPCPTCLSAIGMDPEAACPDCQIHGEMTRAELEHEWMLRTGESPAPKPPPLEPPPPPEVDYHDPRCPDCGTEIEVIETETETMRSKGNFVKQIPVGETHTFLPCGHTFPEYRIVQDSLTGAKSS